MEFTAIKNFSYWISASFITVVAAFIFIALFGLRMHSDSRGKMLDCPLMQHVSSMCPMDAVEHIAAWQRIFTVRPQNDTMTRMLWLLGIVFVVSLIEEVIRNAVLFFERYKHYQQERVAAGPVGYFLLAISNGIVQPKLYA